MKVEVNMTSEVLWTSEVISCDILCPTYTQRFPQAVTELSKGS
jgi:hypothetical protein